MSKKYWPLTAIAICTIIWGSTWLVIKIGLESWPPFWFAGFRFWVATALLLIMMRVKKASFPRDAKSWKIMSVIGLFHMLDYAFVFWGEQFIASAMGAILFGTMPFFVAVLGYFMLDEHHITRTKLSGVVLSFVGVVIIFGTDIVITENSWVGDLAIILASFFGAVIAVYVKKHANEISVFANTTVSMFYCAVSLTLLALVTEDFNAIRWTPTGIFMMLYLAVVGSAIAFVLYIWVIKKVSVLESSIIPVATPVIAVMLGWIVLDEKLGLHSWIGMAFILAGVYFVNIYKQKPDGQVIPTVDV